METLNDPSSLIDLAIHAAIFGAIFSSFVMAILSIIVIAGARDAKATSSDIGCGLIVLWVIFFIMGTAGNMLWNF